MLTTSPRFLMMIYGFVRGTVDLKGRCSVSYIIKNEATETNEFCNTAKQMWADPISVINSNHKHEKKIGREARFLLSPITNKIWQSTNIKAIIAAACCWRLPITSCCWDSPGKICEVKILPTEYDRSFNSVGRSQKWLIWPAPCGFTELSYQQNHMDAPGGI